MGSLVVLIGLLIMPMCICMTMSHAPNAIAPNGFDNPQTTVVIINDLGGSLPLRYHCKSKDDDLGDQTMPPRGSWFFQFKPSVFGNTQFYCSFSWGNELHYFDIYRQDRDRLFAKFGCRRCEWKIHKNGACKLNKDNGMFDVCLPWN
ncbi:Plant self-incompatibility protein S1 family [Raphanus sativus]|uniref:S-protein homolog n=1 Tax=Raphanus sativus TaxID=3726 RepID=A0A6J0LYR0_RAPSA|nr:S-protein homolog 2-like [Raphanus sativus]KAJ4870478.1 Plant self-incompatibility protein S1 family [Raphanus sativus]